MTRPATTRPQRFLVQPDRLYRRKTLRPVRSSELLPELHNFPPAPPARKWLTESQSRWITSTMLVLGCCGAPLLWGLFPDTSTAPPAPPPAAMVIELAPQPTAPPTPLDVPPGPEQAETTPPPEPVPEPEPEPEPEIPKAPPAEMPEVAVSQEPEPESEEVPQLEEETPPPPEEPQETLPEDKQTSQASAPPDASQEDELAAAPNVGVTSPEVVAHRKLTWQNALMLKLNESKQYPSKARRQRQEGIVYLRFTMDRTGRVLAKSIEQSAGYPLLDEESLELMERAQPLPKPPPEVSGDPLEFVVPVEFFLRR